MSKRGKDVSVRDAAFGLAQFARCNGWRVDAFQPHQGSGRLLVLEHRATKTRVSVRLARSSLPNWATRPGRKEWVLGEGGTGPVKEWLLGLAGDQVLSFPPIQERSEGGRKEQNVPSGTEGSSGGDSDSGPLGPVWNGQAKAGTGHAWLSSVHG